MANCSALPLDKRLQLNIGFHGERLCPARSLTKRTQFYPLVINEFAQAD
jgi:hypothetical protein